MTTHDSAQYRRLGKALLASAAVLAGSSEAALNSNQRAMASLLVSTCTPPPPQNEQPFTPPAYCGQLSQLTPGSAAYESIVRQMTPDQILTIGSMGTRTNGGQTSVIKQVLGDRTRSWRLGNPAGGGAGDDLMAPLGLWFKADTDFGGLDSSFAFNGFRYNNFGLTVGADYRITDRWVSGMAFNYHRSNARLDASRGDTDSDSYTGNIYTSYYITDGLHVEATGAYSGFDYQTFRNVRAPVVGNRMTGNPGAGQYAFSVGGGYDFNYQSFIFAPYARTDYLALDVDSFREGGGPAAMQFEQQHIRSLTSTVGALISKAVSLPWGVVTPQLRGEWHHQFMDAGRTVRAAFVSDPSAQVAIVGSSPDRDFYTLGADLSGTFAHGISAFLSYQTLLGSRAIESHKVMLGTRLEF
jgi:outer membrane autotransporter protein